MAVLRRNPVLGHVGSWESAPARPPWPRGRVSGKSGPGDLNLCGKPPGGCSMVRRGVRKLAARRALPARPHRPDPGGVWEGRRVPQAEISRFESGKQAPSEEVLSRMAEAAGVPWEHVNPSAASMPRSWPPWSTGSPPLPAWRSRFRKPSWSPRSSSSPPTTSSSKPGRSRLRRRRKLGESGRDLGGSGAVFYSRTPGDDPAEPPRLAKLGPRGEDLRSERRSGTRPGRRSAGTGGPRAVDRPPIEGEDGWRSQVQGYAWAFVANARRAAGDEEGAAEAFKTAWDLWRAGDGAEPGVLREERVRELEEFP